MENGLALGVLAAPLDEELFLLPMPPAPSLSGAEAGAAGVARAFAAPEERGLAAGLRAAALPGVVEVFGAVSVFFAITNDC